MHVVWGYERTGLTLNRLILSRPEVKRKSFNRSNLTSAGEKTATVEVYTFWVYLRNSPSGVADLFPFSDLLLSISSIMTNLIESTKVQILLEMSNLYTFAVPLNDTRCQFTLLLV